MPPRCRYNCPIQLLCLTFVNDSQVREDISQNLHALEDLHAEFNTQLLLIESGGDNLAANYSRELADYIIYVVCF